jgi:nucleotide-binding universal stress UspA family protein
MAVVLSLKKILCPVDFSDLSLNALRVAVDLASKFQAELHLLHVFEGYDAISLNPEMAMSPMPEWLPKLRQLCHEKLTALPSADLAARCSTIVRADREGAAIHEILEYAAHEKIDLIVLATHGRTGLKHLLMGSVAENVVRSARCPVLTLRGSESQTVLDG